MSILSVNVQPLQEVLNTWIFVAQALVGSIGALAFVLALAWKPKRQQSNR